MADTINTVAASPLPKPSFVGIGSMQGSVNQQALGQAQVQSEIEQSELATSTAALTTVKTSLVAKQLVLQTKQAEAVRLQGDVSSKESQLTSLNSALASAQQDLDNRRRQAEEAARQLAIARAPAAPPPTQGQPVESGVVGGLRFTGERPSISQMPEYQNKVTELQNVKNMNMPSGVVEKERELAAIVSKYQSQGYNL